MKETNIDELKTMTEAPESLALNIGMKGKLTIYKRVDAAASKKAPAKKEATPKKKS